MSDIPNEVVRRFAYKKSLPLEQAELLFGRLESFLRGADSERSFPEIDVDDAWHEFILHTKLYLEYCERKFGKIIHHIPTSPMECGSDIPTEKCKKKCSAGVYAEPEPPCSGGKCSSNCRRVVV